MSLSERLWNLARAELGAARRRVSEGLGDRLRDAVDVALGDREASRPGPDAEWAWTAEAESDGGGFPPPPRTADPQLRRYYANLELREGASLAEVKAAYRRLVRTYHPDRHAGDPAAARITMELRTAYEALTRHLESPGG